MAVVASSAVGTAAVSTSVSVTAPTGITVGDLLIGGAMVYRTNTLSAPSGSWNSIVQVNNDIRTQTWYKIADSGDAAAGSFSFGSTTGDQVMNAGMLRITGFNSADPIQATTQSGSAASGTTITLSALTTDAAGDLVVIWGFSQEEDGWTLSTASAGTNTEHFDATSTAGNDMTITATTVTLTSVGTTGNITCQRGNNVDAMAAHAFVVNAAVVADTPSVAWFL